MKYFIRTYGCQMNVADSSEMGRYLAGQGFEATVDPDEASVYLLNTCTVRQHAEDRALSEIGRLVQWKSQRPNRKLIITGCAAERTKEFLEKRFSHIDLVVGARSMEEFDGIFKYFFELQENDENHEYALGQIDLSVAAFVTIMRGCNYSCTYCIVPYVRGREHYQPLDKILEEVRARVDEGVRDITLLGQTVNSYRIGDSKGGDTDFPDLLSAVDAVKGVERIRFMSPHPYFMSDHVIESMAALPAVCEGLHLPVQSGSNPILKSMFRNYTREYYIELIEKLRLAMPSIVISTDLIVGFPGETQEDFRRTLSLVEEIGFDWGFVFKYSPREGTPAAAMSGHSSELIEERHQECLELVEQIGLKRRNRFLGTKQEILIEESGLGRTRGNYKIKVSGKHFPGDIVSVTVTNTDRATLEGIITTEKVAVK